MIGAGKAAGSRAIVYTRLLPPRLNQNLSMATVSATRRTPSPVYNTAHSKVAIMLSIKGTFEQGVAQPVDQIEGREGQVVIITFLDENLAPHARVLDGFASNFC